MYLNNYPAIPGAVSQPDATDKLMQALYAFLAGKTVNTAKSYRHAIQTFIDALGGNPHNLLKVEPIVVIKFKEELLKDHTIATVANRLSALSALYQYLIRQGLTDKNPITLTDRDDLKVNPYARARKISVEQFNDILKEIPDTLAGVRNRAIFMMICINGLRRSSVLNLKGSDIEYKGNKVFFRTTLKGGKSVSKEIPRPIWESIQCYLKTDGREVDENTSIFMPTRNSGDFLLEYYGRRKISAGLSTEVINQAFKRYAKKADVHNVSIHSLRHLGASMFYKASGDIVETMNFLNHQNISTTQIYLQILNGQKHKHWQEMMGQLGIDD